MPSSDEILTSLRSIATEMRWLSIAWHGVVVASLAALAFGWRPSRRAASGLLAIPLLSVAILAWTHRSPFNAALVGVSAVLLILLGRRLSSAPASLGPPWSITAGALLVAFGLVYPHFLEGAGAAYLFSAPTGLVPCPTLSMVTGFALLANGLGSAIWSVVLALAGLFYGTFGALVLGVHLDHALSTGAAALLVRGLTLPRSPAHGGGVS